MKSSTSERFWKYYIALPDDIKEQAKEAYRQFQSNPYHPSLHYKKIHSTRPIFSVRITKDYRAVGILQDSEVIWFWIGSHSDYDQLIKQLQSE